MNKAAKIRACIGIVLFTLPCVACAQEIFCNKADRQEALFMGDCNDSGQLKLWQNGRIIYADSSDLEQCGQLSFKDLISYLSANQLYFDCDGYEPFWSAKINGNRLSAIMIDDKIEARIEFSYLHTAGSDLGVLFSSEDKTVYGIIKRADMANRDCVCELAAAEHMRYECFISVNGTSYKGCAAIGAIR